MKGEVAPDPDSLVAHREFVEALARRLVDDRHAAEDLTQETLLAALQRPPKAAALRGFLSRVLRIRRARWLRDEERRLRRERAAARPDRAEGGGDLVARLSWHRKVVDTLLALEEPFRTTLLLKFYEDLKPKEIAERLGLPAGTVRARLSRGLAHMRARLDADHKGDRRSWQLGLLPLLVCARPRGVLVGGLAMTVNKKIVAVAALALAVGGTGYLTMRALRSAPTTERADATPAAATAAADRPPDPPDVVTPKGATLLVRVRNQRDEPVPGAEVLALRTVPDPGPGMWPAGIREERWTETSLGTEPVVARAVTDAAGTTTLANLPGNRWSLMAHAGGYGSASLIASGRSRDPVTLRLTAARALRGRVTDTGGAPVAGAVVLAGAPALAWLLGYGPGPFRAVADERGEYAFDSLPAADVSLFAAFPGGLAFHVATLRFPGPERFDIVLEHGGTLTGVVADKAGRPLADAVVRVASREANAKYLGFARSDALGRYVIDALPRCVIGSISVEKPGYAQDFAATEFVRAGIELRPGTTATVDVAMLRGARVNALVLGPDGPVAGVDVDAFTTTPGLVLRKAETGADGRCVLDSLPPGGHLVQAFPGLGYRVEGAPTNPFQALEDGDPAFVVTLEEGEEKEHVIRLARGTLVVEGKVVGPDGRPFPGARVSVTSASTESGEDGSFRLEHVFADADAVHASAPGFSQEEPKPKPGTDVLVRLVPAPEREIAGTVRGSRGEVPKGAYVLLAVRGWAQGTYETLDRERRWYGAVRNPVTEAGDFAIPVSPYMREQRVAWVRAGAPGLPECEPIEISFKEDRERYEVDLTLAPGSALSGVVEDAATGAPVAGAIVSIRRPRPAYRIVYEEPLGPGDAVAAITDGLGTFRIADVGAGWWEVAVSAPGFVAGTAAVELPSSGAVRVALARSRAVAGRVVYGDGSAVAGAVVYVRRLDEDGKEVPLRGVDYGVRTDTLGRFEEAGLEPGDYRLKVESSFLGTPNIVKAEKGPVAAGTTDVRIVVERGLAIEGIVVDAGGQPLSNVSISAKPEGGTGQADSGSTRPDGTFSMFGLRQGRYALKLWHSEKTIVVHDVPAGKTGLRIVFAPESDQRMSIEGTLVDESGMALANRRVRAIGNADDGKYARTDDNGRFAIEGLERGAYRLTLMREYQKPYYLLDLGEAEAGASGIVLVARKGEVIRGTVRDESGPLAGVYASADLEDGDQPIVAKTDALGAFTLDGIPPGATCTVTCLGKEEYVRAIARDVPAGATDVRLVLRRGLEATGRVLRADGGPAAGTTVRLMQAGDPFTQRLARTDGEGRFHAKGLAAGTYEVAVHLDYDYRPCGKIEAGASDVELRVR